MILNVHASIFKNVWIFTSRALILTKDAVSCVGESEPYLVELGFRIIRYSQIYLQGNNNKSMFKYTSTLDLKQIYIYIIVLELFLSYINCTEVEVFLQLCTLYTRENASLIMYTAYVQQRSYFLNYVHCTVEQLFLYQCTLYRREDFL